MNDIVVIVVISALALTLIGIGVYLLIKRLKKWDNITKEYNTNLSINTEKNGNINKSNINNINSSNSDIILYNLIEKNTEAINNNTKIISDIHNKLDQHIENKDIHKSKIKTK